MKKKKPWVFMTEEEIGKIAKKKCRRCQFRSGAYGEGSCDYLLVTGHMRGCRPDECTRFKAGERIKKRAVSEETCEGD